MITLKEFKAYIEDIKSVYDFECQLMELCSTFNKQTQHQALFEIPTLVETSINLLEELVGDKGEWISYWFFELEYGKLADDFTVEDEEGNNIPLMTIEDLWNIIINDKKGDKNADKS